MNCSIELAVIGGDHVDQAVARIIHLAQSLQRAPEGVAARGQDLFDRLDLALPAALVAVSAEPKIQAALGASKHGIRIEFSPRFRMLIEEVRVLQCECDRLGSP